MGNKQGVLVRRLKADDPPVWRAVVVTAIRRTTSLRDAAALLGIAGGTLRRWIRDDPTLTHGLPERRGGRSHRNYSPPSVKHNQPAASTRAACNPQTNRPPKV